MGLSSLNPQAGDSFVECLEKLKDAVVDLIKRYHQERSHNANMAQHFDHSSKNLIRQGLNIGDNSNAADGAAPMVQPLPLLPMVQLLPLLPMVQPLPLLPMVQLLPLLPMVQPLPLLPMGANITIPHL